MELGLELFHKKLPGRGGIQIYFLSGAFRESRNTKNIIVAKSSITVFL